MELFANSFACRHFFKPVRYDLERTLPLDGALKNKHVIYYFQPASLSEPLTAERQAIAKMTITHIAIMECVAI
ncbi:hypothetical protein [Mucilaginibacter gynuensis]|uniref:hypothetical protein n=1 Tax=Mucilaginibacter gynuensis TaxID=1302236 RepID=UPI0031EAE8B5